MNTNCEILLHEFVLFLKGGYIGFSRHTKLNFTHTHTHTHIYITEIYMKKQYKLSIIKNHNITKKLGVVFP